MIKAYLSKSFSVLLSIILITGFAVTSLQADDKEAVQTLYLVRHAEKVADGSRDPALTKLGQTRAKWLAMYFAGKKLDAVYSSNTTRTRETAAPTAELKNLTIELYNPADLKGIAQTVTKAGHTALIVGHSNTTPILANHLTGAVLEELDERTYSLIFVVTRYSDGTAGIRIDESQP
ncbi:phosphoglycerate mutase [Kordiimonas sediminis]|uniref:Phosphoglycerate mutase n=1 Tax=Kordiimonas sediminis TaxID=1735581 RepID=A0A919AKT2_9PROT|nr:phosphoglycerate mutase family protein [Kordiimonas sediminis]GHF14451.1 phosphoglycerate mutase [Kordiimonas sediminis]